MLEAVVQAGPTETRYMRAGNGPQLLVLGRAADAPWLEELVPRLAEHFRIFVPELPPWVAEAAAVAAQDMTGADAVTEWMRGLIGGLGLDRPGIVAAAPLAELLLRFAASDGDRLDRIALIAEPLPAAAGHASAELPASAVLLFPAPAAESAYRALLSFLGPDD
jgi:hypothetical protein